MKIQSIRLRQVLAWAVASIFVLGFFVPFVGAWTDPIVGVWFIGTQKPRRGFLWLVALKFLPSLVSNWRAFPLTGAEQALRFLGWMLLAAVLSALPYLFHRLVSPRLPVIVSTLPLPLAAAAFGVRGVAILAYWFAAVVVLMWNHDLRRSGIAVRRSWSGRPEAIAALRSPFTGEHLQCERERGREALVSASGERFPIRAGIPVFLGPEDLTGPNRKYNHLYEIIGGFYDDSQRVASALIGLDRDAYVMSYLKLLEVKPGDSVLETSVGTGLNFKYLPHGVRLSGLDLSAEMLANCQANLRRRDLEADLFLGNAENLPFADASFDVVFHVGGINFFSDRAKAIREMVRVAKPGSLILIADETEEHVKRSYEHIPITSRYFKHRKETVAPPVDLLPAGMLEVRLDSIQKGRFYALTFRKPAAAEVAKLG